MGRAAEVLPAIETLAARQREIAERFTQIETILLRMAEVVATSNPRQSALLKKVHRESRDRLLAIRLEETTASLQSRRLAETVAAQQQLLDDLLALVRLLESDNRTQQRAAEAERQRETLRQLEDILQRQRSLRAKTERHPATEPLATEQEELRRRTESLETEAARATPSPSPSTQPSTPAPSLAKAQQAMNAAESQLRDAQRSDAIKSQGDAIAALQRAKESLERSLQQTRNEEVIEQLQWLTARLQTMLRLERLVESEVAARKDDDPRTTTSDHERVSGDDRAWRVKVARLTSDQGNVLAEARAAILVLREDGRAQAMAESLTQTSSDMELIRDRLAREQLDTTTQGWLGAVVAALEEMLAAAETARNDRETAAATPPNAEDDGTTLGDENRELLSLLAEIKMIRSMQRRLIERTQRCESMRHAPQTRPEEIAAHLDALARQQATIVQMLQTIRSGKHL